MRNTPYFGGGMSSSSSNGRVSCWIVYTILLVILAKSQVASSDKKVSEEQHEVDKKRQDLLPYPRIGRSTDAVKQLLFKMQEQAMTLEDDANRQQSQEQKKPPSKHHEKAPDHPMIPASEYMLPYLRPGRSQSWSESDSDGTDSSTNGDDNDDEEEGDTMIPYPRIGRSYATEDDLSQSILPYPRFGRSAEQDYEPGLMVPYPRFGRAPEEVLFETITPYPRFGKRQDGLMVIPYPRFGRSDNSAKDHLKILNGESDYITPYPRMGKRFGSGMVQSKRYPNGDVMLPTFRLGRDSSTLLPQIRIGRETPSESEAQDYARFLEYLAQGTDTITPYPRMGKKNDMMYMLPHLRMGRSAVDRLHKRSVSSNLQSNGSDEINKEGESHPRQQRSVENYSVLPYPRFGRSGKQSNTKTTDGDKSHFQKIMLQPSEQTYMLPYMRPGRSGNNYHPQEGRLTMIPYLRMGR